MGTDVLEVKDDAIIISMPFEDLLFDARHDVIHKSTGKKKIYVVKNRYGITSKDSLFSWINPKINRYNKIIRMHEAGKWQQVPLPKHPPITAKELYVYVDFLEKNSNVTFVFVNEGKK